MNASSIIAKLKSRKPSILGEEYFKKYAVLLPLIEMQEETHILFEVRSMNLRTQPGDICFPGGKVDEGDRNTAYTAIRETSEELRIPKVDVYDVFPLDYMVSDFGRIIYPYIGRLKDIEKVTPNKDEVAEIFTVPLSFFLNTKPKKYKVNYEVLPEDNFPYDLIMGGENYDWRTHQLDELFYEYNGKVIWGLTAKILTHFVSLIKDGSSDYF
ncbi:CoA pyrophosphatase [Virgibacillus sp. MSJ-26]|uniref:NUDIX hydrolase n=1 Tax=Virgibacillus sp. MSJ-26 TaxID=2841522 RepID=UPI001C1215B0|nr:CoA pyrophosphatase [Virgibacillus sp. MSJ-26]MBU5468478.1 CoA pyrophosphatase [Virgibacillus sp. MSJ-26]